jgi:hypothetical protein
MPWTDREQASAVCDFSEAGHPLLRNCSVLISVTDFIRNHMMDNPDDLRRRASQYRYIARTTTDAATLKALHELADRYEALATEAQARRDADRKDQCWSPFFPPSTECLLPAG